MQTKTKLYRSLGTLLTILLAITAAAQVPSNKPDTTTVAPPPTQTVLPVPSAYPSGIKVNSISVREAMAPMSDSVFLNTPLSSLNFTHSARGGTMYFDGLGRKLQDVQRIQKPNDASYGDLVAPVVYDEFGRETVQYIPYPQFGSAGNGNFKPDPFSPQIGNIQSEYTNGPPKYPGEQVFYSKTVYEASPLNRVLKVLPPGNSWAGSDRGTSYKYLINTTADSVRIWKIGFDTLTYQDNDTATNIPYTDTTYAAGELYKNVVTDENGNAVVEYKDKDGMVVLKKVQIGTIDSNYNGHTGFLCTYYVYDDLGRQRFVIQPKAVGQLAAGNWQLTGDVINELCFRYEYDERNRTIAKKVPGAGWVYLVYDKRDRLIFTQDANMRSTGKWHTTLYDALNRPVMTGMITYNDTRDPLQEHLNQQSGSGELTVEALLPQKEVLYVSDLVDTATVYEASGSVVFTGELESSDTAEFIARVNGIEPDLETITFAGDSLPSGNDFVALTITYYDNYQWAGEEDKPFTNADNSKINVTFNGVTPWRYVDSVPDTNSLLTTGMVTGTKVRVLENPDSLEAGTWLTSINYYDRKGRVIQTRSDNYKGGTDVQTNRYDFNGLLFNTYLVHHNPAAGTERTRILTAFDYNLQNQPNVIWKQINDTLDQTFISGMSYDYLGNMRGKSMGNYHEKTLQYYSHNIRGWLTGINNDSSGNNTPIWFRMALQYDHGFDNKQYNGNIAGIRWISTGDGEKRAYGFGYDKANRLLYGDFSQYNGSTYGDNVNNNNFDMMMGNGIDAASAYDENGNIKAMKQWGFKPGGSTMIDDLAYSYIPNSNKLLNVKDAVNDAQTKLGDFRTSSLHPVQNKTSTTVDYVYDANGNLVKDLNKDIGADSAGGMVYNHLNLPYKITVYNAAGVKGTISYIYDAAGNKLEKRIEESNQPEKKTTYTGSFVYEDDQLQFFGHEEGRVRYAKKYFLNGDSAKQFIYDYFIKDHLGNVRMVLTEQKDTSLYVATMEAPYRAKEDQLFYNIPQTNYATGYVPGGYPVDTTVTNPNDSLARVNGSGNKVGPAIVLKVMSGDVIDLGVKSFYRPQGSGGSHNNPLTDILTVLATGITGVAGESKGTQGELGNISNSPLLGALTSFLNGRDTSVSTKPRAYLNWILLDEQFKNVDTLNQSGAIPLGNADEIVTLAQSGIDIKKSGYLYIYVSNETQNWDVFFDNLSVKHVTGPLLEETHYYPFGLTMAGISSKAIGKIENKRKFNGIELTTDLDLNQYDAFFRNMDPQTGRWWQIDPKPNMAESPYAMMSNNPVRFSDPLGDTLFIRHRKNDIIYQGGKLYNKDGTAYTGKVRGFLKQTVKALNYGVKKSDQAAKITGELQDSKNHFTIVRSDKNYFKPSDPNRASADQIRTDPAAKGQKEYFEKNGVDLSGGSGGTINWNPAGANVSVIGGGVDNNPVTNLFHEMSHAIDANMGSQDGREVNGLEKNEWQASFRENVIRNQMGTILREFYNKSDGTSVRILNNNNRPIFPIWWLPSVIPVGQ